MNPQQLVSAAGDAAGELVSDLLSFVKKICSPILPTPEEKLRFICEDGSVDKLVALLGENPQLMSQSSPVLYFKEETARAGYTPLTLAARSGNLAIVCFLINNEYSLPDERDKRWGATAVHHAARKNSTLCLTFLLEEAGADVHALTNETFQSATALHWCASHGNLDAAKILFRAHADLNRTDKNGSTPLHWACYHGQTVFANWLVEKGADNSLINSAGWTADDLLKQRGFHWRTNKRRLLKLPVVPDTDSEDDHSSPCKPAAAEVERQTREECLEPLLPPSEGEDLGFFMVDKPYEPPNNTGKCNKSE